MTVNEVTNNTHEEEEGRRRGRRRTRQVAPPTQEATAKQTARKDRPTPARRESVSQGNIITRPLRAIVDYFSTTRAELQKVTWPSREESLRLSGIVIAVTVAFSLALGVLDFLYGELFSLGFSTPVVFIIFAVILAVVVGGVFVALRRRSGF
jgi:preprotein translocase subunit SecE